MSGSCRRSHPILLWIYTTTSAGLQKVYRVQTRLLALQCMCDEGFVLVDGNYWRSNTIVIIIIIVCRTCYSRSGSHM